MVLMNTLYFVLCIKLEMESFKLISCIKSNEITHNFRDTFKLIHILISCSRSAKPQLPLHGFFIIYPMSTIRRYDPLTINPSQSLCDDLVYTEVCVLFHPLDVIGGDVQFLQLFHHLSPTARCKRQRLQQIADWLIDWIDYHVIDCLCCFTSLRWYIALNHKHKLY